MARHVRPLLVVDGYNVIHATSRYEELVDEGPGLGGRLGNDPFDRARELLVSDVAAFAQGEYEAVIVYDAAGNLNPEHPELSRAGVRLVFSGRGQSADEVIEGLVTEAREAGRAVTLVTSDGTVRATAGFGPGEVTCMSSALLAREMEAGASDVAHRQEELSRTHLTLEDRLSPEERESLWKLLGR